MQTNGEEKKSEIGRRHLSW